MDHSWWYYECFGTSYPILIVLTGCGSLTVILWVFWYILPHTNCPHRLWIIDGDTMSVLVHPIPYLLSSQAVDHWWWYYECFGTSYLILIVLTGYGSLMVILWVFWYILPHTYCPHRLWIIDGDTMSVLVHPTSYLLSSQAMDHWWWYYECFGTSYPILIVLTGYGSLMVILWVFWYILPHTYCPHRLWIIDSDTMSVLVNPTPNVLTGYGSFMVILWVFWYILPHTYCPHRLWIIDGDTMSVLVHPTPY